MATRRRKTKKTTGDRVHMVPNQRQGIHAEPANRGRGVAVVAGGAGSMGTVICGALAREGMRVVVGYNRSAEKAKSLAASLPGGGHAALRAPVTDSAALIQLAAEIANRYGVCDVLVNCAGVT